MPPNNPTDGYQLRAIASTLTSVPEASLPAEIPQIVSVLYASQILESAFLSASTKNDDSTLLLNKYKARISSLLQSRSSQAKWCGVALVKASVESSQECLGTYAKTWTPLLVNLLARPEPFATHALVLVTLSRIFNVLTISKPALSREITSQNLKTFIENTLNLISPASSANPEIRNGTSTPQTSSPIENPDLLPACLKALAQTLAAHPTTFRPFTKKSLSIILSLLSQQPLSLSSTVEALAREIYVNLHLCATASSRGGNNSGDIDPRANTAQSVASEWSSSLKSTISETHLVLDTLFKSISEDNRRSLPATTETESVPSHIGLLPLPSDNSFASDRSVLLIRLITTFFTLPTSCSVAVPISFLLQLTNRILSVTPQYATPNPAYSKPTRDLLFTCLPSLHAATLTLLDAVIRRLGPMFIPLTLPTLNQLSITWEAFAGNTQVRLPIYQLASTILDLAGSGLPKSAVRSLYCSVLGGKYGALDDVLPPVERSINTSKSITGVATMGTQILSNNMLNRDRKRARTLNSSAAVSSDHNIPKNAATLADSLLSSTANINTWNNPAAGRNRDLTQAARTLLASCLTNITPGFLPSELRTRIDRAAVLTGDTEMMLASVLYPAVYAKASLLPHLVAGQPPSGSWGGLPPKEREKRSLLELGVQGVVWPRMPVIRVTGEEEQEDGEDEQRVEENTPQNDSSGSYKVVGSSTLTTTTTTTIRPHEPDEDRELRWKSHLTNPSPIAPSSPSPSPPPPPAAFSQPQSPFTSKRPPHLFPSTGTDLALTYQLAQVRQQQLSHLEALRKKPGSAVEDSGIGDGDADMYSAAGEDGRGIKRVKLTPSPPIGSPGKGKEKEDGEEWSLGKGDRIFGGIGTGGKGEVGREEERGGGGEGEGRAKINEDEDDDMEMQIPQIDMGADTEEETDEDTEPETGF